MENKKYSLFFDNQGIYIKKNIPQQELFKFLWDNFSLNCAFYKANENMRNGGYLYNKYLERNWKIYISFFAINKKSHISILQIAIYIAKEFKTEVAFDKNINDEWNEEFIIVNEFGELFIGLINLDDEPFHLKKMTFYDFSHQ